MTSKVTNLLLLFFICVSLICLSFAIPSSLYSILNHDGQLNKFSSSEKGVFQLFQLWQKEHGRKYENADEANRFQIFQKNLLYINEMNAKRKSPLQHRLGLNKKGLNKFAYESSGVQQDLHMHVIEKPSNWGSRKVWDDDDDSCENISCFCRLEGKRSYN